MLTTRWPLPLRGTPACANTEFPDRSKEPVTRAFNSTLIAIAAMLRGTIKDFRWTNPHVFIELLVKNDQGNEEEWSIEMTSPEHLARDGWRPGTLKPGDKVTLNIHPLHGNAKGGEYLSGTGPNGPLLGQPRPSEGRK